MTLDLPSSLFFSDYGFFSPRTTGANTEYIYIPSHNVCDQIQSLSVVTTLACYYQCRYQPCRGTEYPPPSSPVRVIDVSDHLPRPIPAPVRHIQTPTSTYMHPTPPHPPTHPHKTPPTQSCKHTQTFMLPGHWFLSVHCSVLDRVSWTPDGRD